MAEVKQEGTRKSKIYLVAVFGGILALIGNSKIIKPWREHIRFRSLAVQDSNLPAEEVDKYLKRDVSWGDVNILATKEVNVPRLDILMSDPEIIKKASESRFYNSTTNVIDVIVSMVSRDPNFIWGDYCKWRVNGGGALSLQAGKRYGLRLENLLQMPLKPTEEGFERLNLHNIPVEYSQPLLLHGIQPENILGLRWRGIPIKYILPLAKEGLPSNQIADKYSMEKTGIPDEVRERYRRILMSSEYRKDDKIKLWADNGMTIDYLREIVKDGENYVRTAFELVAQGKLNEKKWGEWRPEFSVGDILCALENGYTREFALKARAASGTLQEFHKYRQERALLDEYIQNINQQSQPVLNSAPR